MKHLEDVYIRLSDGLIVFPIKYTSESGIEMINNSLFNHYDSDEPPMTKYDLEGLSFVSLKNIIKNKIMGIDHTLKEDYPWEIGGSE